MDLTRFAEQIGREDPVTCVGGRTQWGVGGRLDDGTREVSAPAGIEVIAPEEMTVMCAAGTTVVELQDALAAHGQTVSLPPWPDATVGGVLAVGQSGIDRLGRGPVRDTVLQARVVVASGAIVKAGGPTVKNVSGYDLCRLLVGSLGTLAFIGDVILRTRPRPPVSHWFQGDGDPFATRRRLHAPSAVLWDGRHTWVLLEGAAADVASQATSCGLREIAGPPALPKGGRCSLAPAELRSLDGNFIAEVGVGIVHVERPVSRAVIAPVVAALNRAVKARFDPSGRLNPGRSPL